MSHFVRTALFSAVLALGAAHCGKADQGLNTDDNNGGENNGGTNGDGGTTNRFDSGSTNPSIDGGGPSGLPVYGTDGAVIGHAQPDGAVVGTDGAVIGTLLADGAVSADGAVIGGVTPGGSGRDDAGVTGFEDSGADPLDRPSTVPGEICRNGFDDNGNGMVDEGCPCRGGQRQHCYAGNPAHAGVAGCGWGMQSCAAAGQEIGVWGACGGAGAPAHEVCDGIDNDCDRDVDEGCTCSMSAARQCYPGTPGTAGLGVCRAGMQSCGRGGALTWGACEGYVLPVIERCDGIDNDCDGTTDEGCNCAIGATRQCYIGSGGTSGVGACRPGNQACAENPDGTSDWGPCNGQVIPTTEICDGVDNDCNGQIDEGCPCESGQGRSCYGGAQGTQGMGPCRAGTITCLGNGRFTDCVGVVNPEAERCDGIDNDCNGTVDDWCRCPPGQTLTFRRRHLGRSSSRSSMISPGDGLATMPQTCEPSTCPADQVNVEVRENEFRCMPPPPSCPANRYPYWTLSGSWRCERGCEILITYGHLYDNEIRCAPRPDVECGPGQTPHFAFESETWVCRPTCDNGQYDIFRFGTAQVCIPC